MTRKFLAVIGILVASIFAGLVYVTSFSITPTDTKIVDILLENEEYLLSAEGVVGAGIARDEDNYIIGIAVYVKDGLIDTQHIPDRLGEFEVYIKRMSETSEFEKEGMIIST